MRKAVIIKAGEDAQKIIKREEKQGYKLIGREDGRLIFESVDVEGRTQMNG